MKQVRMVAPGRIAIEQVSKPVVAPGHVLLKVLDIGICGSDIHVYHGKHPYTSYPIIQGHEFSAEVAEVGEGVSALAPGQIVTVEPSVSCGTCYSCTHSRYNICDRLKVMGFQTDGAAREFFLVPAGNVVPLPAGFPRDLGALIEPLAVADHAVRRFGDVHDRKVLVLGAGPIGNLVAQAAGAMGASSVALTDRNPFRLEIAVRCGLANPLRAGDPADMDRLQEFLVPDGVDAIFECVGAQETIEQAIETARKGSRIVVVGVFGDKPRIDMGFVQDRELELIGTLMYRREDYLKAIELVQDNLVRLRPLITHCYSMTDYIKAYNLIDEQPGKVMKVLVNVAE